MPQEVQPVSRDSYPWAIFLIFLQLGLTSFGGPVAHLGYFRDEFVTRRAWLTERAYAEVVALCQFLPGPASSQVGIALGYSRAGFPGAFAAWLGFTLPSALLMMAFAGGLARYAGGVSAGVLHGLKLVAVAIVAQAVWAMAKNLCTDALRMTIMVVAASIVLLMPYAWVQVGVIFLAGLLGTRLFRRESVAMHEALPLASSRRSGVICLGLFFALLLALPVLVHWMPGPVLAMIDVFYRAGALVFGGGHVVLPLLQAAVVPAGWVDNETFLAGYGAAQAVPGPLFTFAAFLGTAMTAAPWRYLGGLLCLVAIFLPAFLLVLGVLPFWQSLRALPGVQAALSGINAAVVGLLLAAFYQPVWVSAIHQPQDVVLALLAFMTLLVWKQPPWLVVLVCGALGYVLW
ncbi:chromate efflux transporter [Uliginosibacterium gangwonense]|uniref:chromate efflux transporter n=1 Tax=Uliginosibacterium gangwonense TaxID=392736 RepID=UPI00039CCBC6|nr:chromate efflux transporter [Uliginosibacterium gangwonense]